MMMENCMTERHEEKIPRYGPRLEMNYAEMMKRGYSVEIECMTVDDIRESIFVDDEDNVVDMLNEERLLALNFIISDESEEAA